MKQILYLTIAIAALGLWSCQDEPEISSEIEILPSEMAALKVIHKQLEVNSKYYPVQWDPEDKNTWKNAGIELDTIINEETRMKNLTVSSITLYLVINGYKIPKELLNLTNLKELKVYGCAGSYLNGDRIPASVKSLLIDRMHPDDPGYIVGMYNPPFYSVILGNYRAVFDKVVIHGLQAARIDFRIDHDATLVDISHNTFEGKIGIDLLDLKFLKTPANLSYNHFSGVQPDWNLWKEFKSIPIVQHNLIEDIPQEVLQSDFWKENHEKFIGNPGYVAPQP